MPRKKKTVKTDVEELEAQEEAVLEEALETEKVSDDVILPYKHLSQNSPTANWSRNDCGAACVAILARGNGLPELTVDGVAMAWMARNKPMYMNQVQRALAGFGIRNRREQDVKSAKIIRRIMEDGKPYILLVHYPSLPHQAIDYNHGHYIVVHGVKGDGTLVYLDPLSDGSKELTATPEEMNKALEDCRKDGNLPFQGITIT